MENSTPKKGKEPSDLSDSYPLIENHGIIGNMLTTALISNHADMNFMCYPYFDSPAIFCSLLDSNKGGFWSIKPQNPKEEYKTRQSFWPSSNLLQTKLHMKESVVNVIDYMPIVNNGIGLRWVVRKVKCIRGTLNLEMKLKPTFNFARDKHTLKKFDHGCSIMSGDTHLDFISHAPLRYTADELGETIESSFTLHEGDNLCFILKDHDCCHGDINSKKTHEQLVELESHLFRDTVFYWQKWLDKCTYKGRWREMVERSALVLKLLTFSPTGAIVAAPTCSLPEGLGGERNWDYRYTWIRDAAFTIYGLIRIGFTEEAHNFMKWLEDRCKDAVYDDKSRMPLRIMYSIHGNEKIPETTLPHLEGYYQSKPVRIGNDAANQMQLDIFGELMDSIYLSNKYGTLVSYEFWTHIRSLVDWVADNYSLKDEGIWEVRSGRQHFTYSKIMCWVALDRGLRLADRRSFPAPRDKWTKIRDKIYEEIQTHGYDKELESFVQFYGSKALDASTLIMPLVFFMAPSDPRNLNTLKAISKPPHKGGLVSNSLVFRYNLLHAQDGLEGEEGTFNICSFWLIENLTRSGFVQEARLMFDEMLGYANHLGLFSEEIGIGGEALGNFPQAFTHLSLISAAFNLDKVLSGHSQHNA
ncbi:hypothetical protein CYY_005826 [Polysphondylium violaceum]|uniref:Glycoside hydrolase family 15 protein n=1 Tax=Polysphondylium violaceum TaxID=133409 RepID=A0A8J4PVG8_9MYCE|nr:hypothetical protein CYY_005826 [Polysphondylium violaceum]